LPWLDAIQKPEDTRAFLERQLSRFAMAEALHEPVFYQGRIAGVLSRIFHELSAPIFKASELQM